MRGGVIDTSIKGNTSATGFITLGLPVNQYEVDSIVVTNGSNAYVAILCQISGNYGVMVADRTTLTPITSATYVELSFVKRKIA